MQVPGRGTTAGEHMQSITQESLQAQTSNLGVVVVSEGPGRNVRPKSSTKGKGASDMSASLVQSVQSASENALTTMERMFGRVNWLRPTDNMLSQSERSGTSSYVLTQKDVSGIDLSAGADLHNRFRGRWDEIHNQNVKNIVSGRRVKGRTVDVGVVYHQHQTRIARMTTVIKLADELSYTLGFLSQAVLELGRGLVAVELALGKLENLSNLEKVAVHVRAGEKELNNIKKTLAAEYEAKKAVYLGELNFERRRVHEREMKLLNERRAVYDQHHREDMKRFNLEKTSSTVPEDTKENTRRTTIHGTDTSANEKYYRGSNMGGVDVGKQPARPTKSLKDVVIDDLIGDDDNLDDFYAD
eukprot:CFRG2638T1